jgi:enoyl-CoA hydratase/carnithine racemase
VVGPAKAVELLLTDPVLNADQALDLGIVSEVVPADELGAAAGAKARELAAKAPHYVRMAKLLVAQSLDNTLADHLQVERHGIADSMATEDLREGVGAFFERREATFTGN